MSFYRDYLTTEQNAEVEAEIKRQVELTVAAIVQETLADLRKATAHIVELCEELKRQEEAAKIQAAARAEAPIVPGMPHDANPRKSRRKR
jgi:hypothetical protein